MPFLASVKTFISWRFCPRYLFRQTFSPKIEIFFDSGQYLWGFSFNECVLLFEEGALIWQGTSLGYFIVFATLFCIILNLRKHEEY